MEKYICKICNELFKKEWLLKKHLTQKHNTDYAYYCVKYFLDGKWPTCECGCGQKVKHYKGKLAKGKYGFAKYINGHISRVENHWGHNENAKKKSIKTRRKLWKDGKLKIWCDGVTFEDPKYGDSLKKLSNSMKKENNPDRAKKISKSLTGRKFTKKHIENIGKKSKEYWSKEENREKQRKRRLEYLKSDFMKNPSVLELCFKKILSNLGIEYDFQYEVGHFLYDFCIKDKKILIEVDGDFYHCRNGNPVYKIQEKTIKHDEIKNKVAKKYGYKLLRFWEYDINNNIDVVVDELKRELNI